MRVDILIFLIVGINNDIQDIQGREIYCDVTRRREEDLTEYQLAHNRMGEVDISFSPPCVNAPSNFYYIEFQLLQGLPAITRLRNYT